eukprot:364408-Chlamydomonas_euryale.AAC.5
MRRGTATGPKNKPWGHASGRAQDSSAENVQWDPRTCRRRSCRVSQPCHSGLYNSVQLVGLCTRCGGRTGM